MRIGIFGGSFNPPHRMHKGLVEEILRKDILDKVIVVPVGDGYNWNSKKVLPHRDRINLVNILFEGVSNVEVSDIEKDGPMKTWDIMKKYQSIYPNDELYYICGSDNLAELNRWYRYEDLLKEFRFLIIGRNTNDYEEALETYKEYVDHISLANVDMDDVSSTRIRKLIKEGGFSSDVEKLIPRDVCEALMMIDYPKYW